MGSKNSKETKNQKIIAESSGLLNQQVMDFIYMTYNFTQNELSTIVDEYRKLCSNRNGLITPTKLMEFPPFHYSPFGYHILDVLDLNPYKGKDALEKLENKEKIAKANKLKLKANKKKEKTKKKNKNG